MIAGEQPPAQPIIWPEVSLNVGGIALVDEVEQYLKRQDRLREPHPHLNKLAHAVLECSMVNNCVHTASVATTWLQSVVGIIR